MPLYELKIKNKVQNNSFSIYSKFLIFAKTEKEAREIAQKRSFNLKINSFKAETNIPIWNDITKTQCKKMNT